MSRRPWFPFYPPDWRADPALRSCSLVARGLWMEMLCIMHEAEPRGSLLINGKQVTERQLAALTGAPLKQVAAAMVDLDIAGVFSREEAGTIYSRRMRRDDAKAAQDKANGRRGGNPDLVKGVNPTVNRKDKAHIPEPEPEKKKDAANAASGEGSSDPKTELFRRGEQVLGKNSGGLVVRLLKAKEGKIPLARAALETASTANNAREYIGRIVNGKEAETQDWRSAIL